MTTEHVPQIGFLQVKHIHLVVCGSMTFSVFSRKISIDGGGIGSTF